MLKPSENPPIIWRPDFADSQIQMNATEDPAATRKMTAPWPEEKSISDFTGLWRVAHTKSRNEKALAHDLIRRNISYFLPMTWKVHRRRTGTGPKRGKRRPHARTIRSLLPLFSGYLFFCGDENQRTEVLRTNRVANIIEVRDQQKLLQELLQIEQALRTGVALTPHRYIKAGQRCRVITGPLADLCGIVLRTRRSARLVLQIDMLGQAASVEIDIDMIEVIDEAH